MAGRVAAALVLVACLHVSDAELQFASYYGDHMVLQKSPERAVLWGYGPEGAPVTVFLSGLQLKNFSASVSQGTWRVTLQPVEAGGPYNVTAVTHNATATLTDVLFGDVWLCGGQSNMYFKTSQIFNASEELSLAAEYPHVRPFMVALNLSQTELSDLLGVELPWSVPSAGVVGQFSAVCWLFGRYLYDTLKYPIGLVESCWGGTPIEAWSSLRALQQCGLEGREEGQSSVAHLWPGADRHSGEQVFSDMSHEESKNNNSVLWNAMIHPLISMTIKGAIWYQGEANAQYHQDKYNCSFPAMIDDWRMAFHQGSGGQTAPDFPFGFVQLCTTRMYRTSDSFPNIRWHQTADYGYVPNARMPKTFMAVTLDLPDKTSPYGQNHPRDKQDVASRLTLGARAVAYGEPDVPFQGPFPRHIQSSETGIIISYNQTVSVTLSNTTFEVCCSENQAPCGPTSNWTTIPIMSWGPSTVRLSPVLCLLKEEVAALRYAWRDWPCDFKACPIYSAGGVLPAPPFISHTADRKVWRRLLDE